MIPGLFREVREKPGRYELGIIDYDLKTVLGEGSRDSSAVTDRVVARMSVCNMSNRGEFGLT